MEKLVGQFEKNAREEVRVQLREFKGHQLLDIRTFYFTAEGGEPKPSPKGISIPLRLLPQVKEAILEAERVLKDEGILNSDGELVDDGGAKGQASAE